MLIIGPGAIGLMFVASLRQQGVRNITLAGRNPERLAIGEGFGARTVKYPDVGTNYDLVIECTGKVEVWEASLNMVRRGGTVVLFGGCPSGTTANFDTGRLHYDEISLISPFHFGTTAVRTARSWLLDPEFDLTPLVSGERALEDGEQVFRDLEASKGLKYVFRP